VAIRAPRHWRASRHGHLDVAGNVWEWCGDRYRPDYRLNYMGVKANLCVPSEAWTMAPFLGITKTATPLL